MVSAAGQVQVLLGIDALLAMDGIIPSISQFRDQMRLRIRQLDATLAASGWPEADKAQICALLCRRIDTHIAAALARHHQPQTVETLGHECYPHATPGKEVELLWKLFNTCQPACVDEKD